jgi:hypothetical protein
MTNNDKKVPYLNDFQQELDNYKQVNQMMKLPKQRVNSIIKYLFGFSLFVILALFIRINISCFVRFKSFSYSNII